jgi:hypothetical protein
MPDVSSPPLKGVFDGESSAWPTVERTAISPRWPIDDALDTDSPKPMPFSFVVKKRLEQAR